MSKLVFSILIVLLLAGTVFSLPTWYVYDSNIDSYTGQIARDRRLYDPNSRDRYFGSDYEWQYWNLGRKGPNDRMANTGAKSAYSGVFNLDTNTFSNQGRNPGHISNWDPNVRGFARVDRAVDLLPFTAVTETIGPQDKLQRGVARVLSFGDAYGSTLNKAAPRTQFFVQAINLPPIGQDEMYEAWLFDAETEYALSLGLMKTGTGLSVQLYSEMSRMVSMFDSVMITREPFPDADPSPGEIVLWGDFAIRRDVNPPASDYERLR